MTALRWQISSYNPSIMQPTARIAETGPIINSWNCGVEGPSDDPAVLALRARQMRNLLATTLLARGTPMLLGGEVSAHSAATITPICQDNEDQLV